MNPAMMDEDEIDPALAEAAGVEMPSGRANVPRDPDDPREKIKQYLLSQEKASQLRQDPGYRAMERAPAEAINESNRSIDFAKLLNQSANQFGSLGGKVASSAPMDQFSKGLKESNQSALGSIMGQRQAAAGDEDRQLKIKQYLSDKMQSDEDRALRRDMLASSEKRANQSLGIQREKLDIMKNKSDPGVDRGGELLSGIPERLWNKATDEIKKVDEHVKASNDAVANAAKMSGITFKQGNLPGALGGRQEEYNKLKANVAAAVISKVPGIRSDADYKNIVVPMLPRPGDPPDVAEGRVKTFRDWLAAQSPETPVLRNYGKDKMVRPMDELKMDQKAPSAAPAGTVTMKNKEGRIFHIPADQVQAAKMDPDEPLSEAQ